MGTNGAWVKCPEQLPEEYDYDLWVYSPTYGVVRGVAYSRVKKRVLRRRMPVCRKRCDTLDVDGDSGTPGSGRMRASGDCRLCGAYNRQEVYV